MTRSEPEPEKVAPRREDRTSLRGAFSSLVQVHILDRDIPVAEQDFEPPLLLALEGLLVREEFLLDRLLARGIVRRRRYVLEDYRDAVIPAPVLRGVVARLDRRDSEDAPGLDLLLQDGEVILLEQADELVSLTPASLVVVFGNEGLVLRLRLLALYRHDGSDLRTKAQGQQEQHTWSQCPGRARGGDLHERAISILVETISRPSKGRGFPEDRRWFGTIPSTGPR